MRPSSGVVEPSVTEADATFVFTASFPLPAVETSFSLLLLAVAVCKPSMMFARIAGFEADNEKRA